MKESLIPKTIHQIPKRSVPFSIDWDASIWAGTKNHFVFNLSGVESHLYDTDIELREENAVQGNSVFFAITNSTQRVEFILELFENRKNPDNVYSDYRIVKVTDGVATIKYGRHEENLETFLYDNAPTIFFADGSSLCGTEYIELKTPPTLYDRSRIIGWNWQGVDLSVESQGVAPNLRTNSIQYHVVQRLINGDYDIVYDDDNAGEIADVVTLKQENNAIHVELFHLKFALSGKVTGRVGNFYEVCGQAQKSSNWKYKEPEEMFDHLLRRETKRDGAEECSRIQKGNHETLVKLLKLAKKKMPVMFSIYIVQPGASKAAVSNEILSLLGVTDSFLKDRTGIDLKVITSE